MRLWRPTDVSCDVENEDTLNEYQGMMQQSDTVVQNAVIDTQNLQTKMLTSISFRSV